MSTQTADLLVDEREDAPGATKTRRFEAPTLEEALTQVQQQLGEQATIVEANKLRRGGLGGFFARERFEVVVEDPGTPASTPDDLRDDPTDAGFGLDDGSGRPLTLLDLVDLASDNERADQGGPSTEGSPFAEVLNEVARTAGLRFDTTVDGPRAVEPFELADLDAPMAGLLPPVAPSPAFAAQQPQPTQPARPARPLVARPLVTSRHADAASEALVPTVPASPAQAQEVTRALVRSGFPATAFGSASDRDPEMSLRRWLADLPTAPALPTGKGAVVAVAGARDEALALARRLAAEAGIDPRHVLLATPERRCRVVAPDLRLHDRDHASSERRSWRRRARLTVVAVETPPTHAGDDWAASMLDALEPTVVWATVPATRKPEDLAAWFEAVGGVDAVDVVDAVSTASPASVLLTGVVVGRLDGEPATVERWLELVRPAVRRALSAGICDG